MSRTGEIGAVAAGHRLTAETAIGVLRDGGNAIDALIAAIWTACVCEPVLAAPAGGGFTMVKSGDDIRLFDFFCDTPRARATETEFAEVHADFGPFTQAFHIGAGAAATPGFMAGIAALHRAHGSWPMADLVLPAVTAARAGVTITKFQSFLQEVVSPILTWTPEARSVFAADAGTAKVGETVANPGLADALMAIGAGEHSGINAAILEQCREFGGHLTSEDIDGYAVLIRAPIQVGCGDWTVFLNPAPALGGVLAGGMLNALMNGNEFLTDTSRASAMARVDAAWRKSGDQVGAALGLADSPTTPAGGAAFRGTTHISVIDRDGRAASTTVSNGEGNGRILTELGFMLNNMLGEEDLNPDGFDSWIPGRRLASMMAPAIVTNPSGAIAALGSGGSNRIRTAIFQALAARLLNGHTPERAVEAPRLHFEKGRLDIEFANGRRDVSDLQAAYPGARLWPERSVYFGGVHWAEMTPDGRFYGAGDPRRAGVFLVA